MKDEVRRARGIREAGDEGMGLDVGVELLGTCLIPLSYQPRPWLTAQLKAQDRAKGFEE